MKYMLLAALPFVFAQSVMARGDSLKIKLRNTVGLEIYRPVETADEANNSLNDVFNFFSADYPNGQMVEALRKKTLLSYGLSYEHEFKNQMILRARGGYSIIRSDESDAAKFDTSILNSGIPFLPTLSTSETWENEFSHRQNKINLFIGVGKRFLLNRKFSFDVGFETAFIRSLEGLTEYRTFNSTSLSSFPISSNESITTFTSAPSNTFGMGPFFKPTYYPIPRLALSLEAQMFLLTRFGTSSTRVEEKSEVFNAGSFFPGGGGGSTNTTNNSYTLNQSGTQWNWSLISPLLRIGFRF